MTVEDLQADGFFRIGAFRSDVDGYISFEPWPAHSSPENVIYSYTDDGCVVYFGQTGGCARTRNVKLANDTRLKVERGQRLIGAAWQVNDAVEQGREVMVWSGQSLAAGVGRAERKQIERGFMLRYKTLHSLNAVGWNEYKLPS